MPKFLLEIDGDNITVSYHHVSSDNQTYNYYLTRYASLSIYPSFDCMFSDFNEVKTVIEKFQLIMFDEEKAIKIPSYELNKWLNKLWKFPFFNSEFDKLNPDYIKKLRDLKEEFASHQLHPTVPYLLFFHYGKKYNDTMNYLQSSIVKNTKSVFSNSWEDFQPSLSFEDLNIRSAVAFVLGLTDLDKDQQNNQEDLQYELF